jgi:ATP-dependent Clp protease ATP-binding subunit ClpA
MELDVSTTVFNARWEVENQLAREMIDARRRRLQTILLRNGDSLSQRAELERLEDEVTRLIEPQNRFEERVLGQPEPIGEHSRIRDVVRRKLGRVGERVMRAHGVSFQFNERAVDWIASRCDDLEFGAWKVDAVIDRTILPEASRALLVRASGVNADRPAVLTLGMSEDGFTYTFTDAVSNAVETAPSFEMFVDDEQFLVPVG